MHKLCVKTEKYTSLEGMDKDMDSTNNITSYTTQEINRLIQWQNIMLCQM